jgi:hypothetical protein
MYSLLKLKNNYKTSFIVLVSLGILTILFFSIRYYNVEVENEDYNFENGLPDLNGNERMIIKFITELHQNNDKETAFKLLSELNNKAQKEDNKLAQYYFHSLKCYILITEEQFEQSVNHGKKAISIANRYFDTMNISHTYQNVCAAYFQTGQKDSGEKYTKLGFGHALNIGDSAMLKTFSMNLGTISFNKNLLGLAGYYFTKAANIKTPGFATTDTLLYANLVSILINKNDYDEAEKLWQEHQLDEAIPGKSYVNQHLLNNKISLLQAQKKWDKSRQLLKGVNYKDFEPDFKEGIFTITWWQLYNDKGIEACNSYFSEHKNFIEESFPFLAPTIVNNIPHNDISKIKIFTADYINKLIEKHKVNESDDHLIKYATQTLLGLILAKEQKHKEATQAFLNAINAEKKYNSLNDSLRVTDINYQIKFERLLDDQYELNQKLTSTTKQNQILILLGSVSILFLITLVVLFYLNFQRKQVELQLMSLEKKQMEEKDKHLEKEKQLNNRIVELSKSIIIKTNELGNNITTQPSVNSAKELYKIKRELAKISHFENIEHPEIADQLYETNELFEKLFPSLRDFNKTERRIFALSIEDYKVKDISTLMGLSGQYVHNVRSRLKKKVGFTEDISWSEFKQKAIEESNNKITS